MPLLVGYQEQCRLLISLAHQSSKVRCHCGLILRCRRKNGILFNRTVDILWKTYLHLFPIMLLLICCQKQGLKSNLSAQVQDMSWRRHPALPRAWLKQQYRIVNGMRRYSNTKAALSKSFPWSLICICLQRKFRQYHPSTVLKSTAPKSLLSSWITNDLILQE